MAAWRPDSLAPAQRQATFARMLQALARPEAFAGLDHVADVGSGEPIEIRQTHASAVLLSGERAYKLKKPNDFGFFDYSTPDLRRHFCGEEVRLNARLAPHVYLGVAPVVALDGGAYRFARACAPDATPAPGDQLDGGRVVDYAVVMTRLPEEATLEARVRADRVRPEQITAIAERVVAFHAAARSDDDIARFGAVEVIQRNWDENFEQIAPYLDRVWSASGFDRVRAYVSAFLQCRRSLFDARVQAGRIRDCHGDLRLQHVYLLDRAPLASPSLGDTRAETPASSDPDTLAIVDCIEFNERFRYGDVAAEIAFLTMELDAAGRPDLARVFTDAYITATHDEALSELLPFYACYRACVRGKVLALLLDEPETPTRQREEARRQARFLFELAERYASAPAAPTVALVGGLMGVGKSTLARHMAHELGWTLLSSDAIRKELAGVAAAQPQAAPYNQGIYTPEWSARTYQAMLEKAASCLAEGRSVILDASFSRRADRQAAGALARSQYVRAWFIECVCPRDVTVARLLARWRRKQEASATPSGAFPAELSDGRPEIYDAQAAAWQPFDPVAEPALTHLRVDTDASVAASVAQTIDTLGVASVACWL